MPRAKKSTPTAPVRKNTLQFRYFGTEYFIDSDIRSTGLAILPYGDVVEVDVLVDPVSGLVSLMAKPVSVLRAWQVPGVPEDEEKEGIDLLFFRHQGMLYACKVYDEDAVDVVLPDNKTVLHLALIMPDDNSHAVLQVTPAYTSEHKR